MKNIRLAYLVSQYPAVSHTFVLREVRWLRDNGFDIEVASINDADRPADRLTAEEREEASRTLFVKSQGAAVGLSAVLGLLFRNPSAFFRGLREAIRLGGTDVMQALYGVFYWVEAAIVGQWMASQDRTHLHVHFATPAATVGVILKKMFPTTLSITVHGPDEFYNVGPYRLQEKIEASDFVCCIGHYARSQLMKLSPYEQWDKFEVSPLGVDPSIFSPRPTPEGADIPEVICVGRLVPAKGQHILVRAIARLRDRGVPVRLRLVGAGPDRESLEQDVRSSGIGDLVIFEGAVNQDQIRELYSQAHVFSIASFAEGIPVVLMEAMAMEIPVVTTFITGIPELIRDGIDGRLVAPSDDEGLADAIQALVEDPEAAAELGRSGRRRVEEKYHLQRNTARLGEIFRRRLTGEASSPAETDAAPARVGTRSASGPRPAAPEIASRRETAAGE